MQMRDSIPREFLCPISYEIMRDPVQIEMIYAGSDSWVISKANYERVEIEKWLRYHNTEPVTNLEMIRYKLIPNVKLKEEIQQGVQLLQISGELPTLPLGSPLEISVALGSENPDQHPEAQQAGCTLSRIFGMVGVVFIVGGLTYIYFSEHTDESSNDLSHSSIVMIPPMMISVPVTYVATKVSQWARSFFAPREAVEEDASVLRMEGP